MRERADALAEEASVIERPVRGRLGVPEDERRRGLATNCCLESSAVRPHRRSDRPKDVR
jgi:hypothetical protein